MGLTVEKNNIEDRNNQHQYIDAKFIKNANKVDYFPVSRSNRRNVSQTAAQENKVIVNNNPNKSNS